MGSGYVEAADGIMERIKIESADETLLVAAAQVAATLAVAEAIDRVLLELHEFRDLIGIANTMAVRLDEIAGQQ